MVAVQRIAAAAEIVVVAVRREHVVDVIVQPFKGKGRSLFVALRRVVEDHIQDHFDLIVVKGFDQILQLGALLIVFVGGGVAGIGSEKTDRVVTPVVQQPVSVHHPGVHGFVKLKDGHQFHRVDAQILQVGNLLLQAGEGAFMNHAGGGMAGEAPHMKLIDDQVAQFPGGLGHISPVEDILHHAGMVAAFLFVPPDPLSGHGAGIGIQQDLLFVKEKPLFRLPGAVHPVSIFEFFDVKTEDDHGIDVPDLIFLRERNHGVGLLLIAVKQKQLTGSALMGMYGEVDSHRQGIGAVDVKHARPYQISGDLPHGSDGKGILGSEFSAVQFQMNPPVFCVDDF